MVKIYFAGCESKASRDLFADYPYILLSYYALKKKEKTAYTKTYFLDSGAFSAYNSNAKIDIDEYIKFIQDNSFEIYANLDVIFNGEKSLANLRYMESKGLHPIPVFHYSEPYELLELYCKQYPFIAIGGVAQIREKKNILIWLKKVFDITERYGTKVHGFAVTRPDLLALFPFYSVDSTTWQGGNRYGAMYVFNKGHLETKARTNYKMKFEDYQKLTLFNITQWLKYAKHIEELWNYRKSKSKI